MSEPTALAVAGNYGRLVCALRCGGPQLKGARDHGSITVVHRNQSNRNSKESPGGSPHRIESAVDSTPHALIPFGPPTQAIELKLDRKHGPHTTSPRGLLLCLLAPGLPTAHGPPCPFKMMPSRIFSSPQGRRSGRRGPAAATQVTGQQPLAVRPRPKSERRSESDTT